MDVRTILAAALLFPLLAGCGKKSAPQETFLNDPSALEAITSFDSQCTKAEGEARLLAKYAILDAEDKTKAVAARLSTRFPDAEWARNWKELQTLVLVRSTSKQVGTFKSSGLAALQWTSTVTVIDVPKRQIVHQKSFRGGMPEKRVLNSDASTAGGEKPDYAIRDWLESLPRK